MRGTPTSQETHTPATTTTTTPAGGLANRVGWHGQHGSHKDYPRGTYAASVYSDGSSWALLNNGSVCYSGGPWDSRHL
jgi:hypothetical protein